MHLPSSAHTLRLFVLAIWWLSLASCQFTRKPVMLLKNLRAVLKAAGSSMEKVKKVTVFVRDKDEFSNMNEVYKQYFNIPFPARSLVEVSRLPKDVKVEIEALATV